MTAIPCVILAAVVVMLAFSSVYTVDPNEQAVVLRFGKKHAVVPPGLHFCIPVVDEVLKVNMQEHSVRLPAGIGGERSEDINEEDTLVLTGDLNVASVEWTIQWKVVDPALYSFSFHRRGSEDDLEDVIRVATSTVMNRLVGDYSIDEVLTAKRAEIGEKARAATQVILDRYDCGVVITDLQMQRVTPPNLVKPAFDSVVAAQQIKDQLENEANKERAQLLPKARADADRLIREAEGYVARRRSEVDGEISALQARYKAYQRSPDLTRRRLYLESMEELLLAIPQKTIIDDDLKQLLPLLNLESQGGQP
jgi:membrane protease subunit HflK